MVNRVISDAELCQGDRRRREIFVIELAAACEISCEIVRMQLYSFDRRLPAQPVIYPIFILCYMAEFMGANRCDIGGRIGWLVQKFLEKTQAKRTVPSERPI